MTDGLQIEMQQDKVDLLLGILAIIIVGGLILTFQGCSSTSLMAESSNCRATVDFECDCSCEDESDIDLKIEGE